MSNLVQPLNFKKWIDEHRHLLKKQIRDENIKNFLKTLKTHLISNKERSVFSGKIGVFNKKTCINLT